MLSLFTVDSIDWSDDSAGRHS